MSTPKAPQSPSVNPQHSDAAPKPTPQSVKEIGGQSGPEPTRYGDWEKNGRCTDF